MTVTLFLVLAGFLSLAAVLFLARGHGAPINTRAKLREQIRPLDIEAFRNLVDRREEEFLRARLGPPQFRSVQRARQLAAIDYVLAAASNAAILHRLGEAARISANVSTAETGEKLVNSAIRFRLYAFQVVAGLYLATLWPGSRLRPLRIADGYERLTHMVVLLGCLQPQRQEVFDRQAA